MRKAILWVTIITFITSVIPLPAQTVSSTPASNASLPAVAVLPLDIGAGVDPNARVTLTEELQNALFKTGKLNLQNQAEMDKVLRQHNFNLSGCTTSECAVKVGQILQVQKIITGSVTLLGSTYTVTIKLTDVETGTVENMVNDKCQGCKIDDLLKIVQQLAIKLIGPKNLLSVTSTPAGASVYINGEAYGTTPLLGVELASGKYDVVVKLDGYRDSERGIQITPNAPTELDFILVKGEKPWYKKKWVLIAIGLVVIGGGAAAAGMGGGGGGGGGNSSPSSGSIKFSW